jgi:outer membrane protein assembly factor BamB
MIRMDKLAGAALCALLGIALAGCGGAASTTTQLNGNNGGGARPTPFDPARAEVMFGTVSRSTSGVPTGVRLTWTAQADAVSYNVYRSNAAIPDAARGDAGQQVGHVTAASGTTFDDVDFGGGAAPQIGQTWFYRLSAVDSDGDESRLSPQLQVDITLHFVTALDKATAAVGDTVTITGQNFGVYNAATDSVTVPGVVWQSTAPVGFQVAQLDCPVVAGSWSATSIAVRMPLGFTQGPLSVVIASNTANSPTPVANTDPYITSLSPTTADVTQTVTLQGKNFGALQDSTHYVHFGTQDITAAGNYVAYGDTQIQFKPANLRDFTSQEVTVDAVGRASNSGFCDLADAPPVPSAVADKTSGYGALTVNFDASNSSDPEGAALTYDWDFNNDGSYDLVGAGPQVTHTYSVTGNYQAVVRVDDADGGKATLSPAIGISVLVSKQGPWFMFGHDERHTHRSSIAGPQASAFPRRTYASAPVVASPAFAADGTVYSAGQTGQLSAYNEDGTVKWKSNVVSGGFTGSPVVGPDGTVYCGDIKGDLYAYNAADGTQKWKYSTSSPMNDSAAVDSQGHIYIGDNAGNLTAVRDDGPNAPFQLWQQQLPGAIHSSPAVGSDGTVYVGCDDGVFYAFKADGTPKWNFNPNTGNPIVSSPAIADDGTVYFTAAAAASGILYALKDNGTSGSSKWVQGLDAVGSLCSPALQGNGHVIIGDTGGYLYEVRDNGSSDTVVNQYPALGLPAPGTYSSSPCIGSDNKVYIGNDDGHVYCLDSTLTPLWNYDTGSAVKSSPAIGPDGALYVGDSSGLLALGIKNPRPPTGDVSPDLSEAGLNFSVTFTVNASSPEQAKLTSYDFDFGDGTTQSGVATNTANHSYNTGGLYTVKATAHDDNGKSTQFTTQTKIWTAISPVSGAAAVKLGVARGRPSLAYLQHAPATGVNSVYFMSASDADGTAWPAPPATALFGSTSVDISDTNFDMAVSGSNVAIIYVDVPLLSRLNILTSADGGANWQGPFTIPSLGALLGIDDAHVTFVNGMPAVAFVDRLTKLLEYEKATKTDGSTWNSEIQLVSGGVLLPRACDVAEVGGRAAVAFCTDTEVRYFAAQADNGDSGDWNLLVGSNLVANLGTGMKAVSLGEFKDPFTVSTFPGIATLQQQTSMNVDFITGNLDFSSPNTPVAVHSGQINNSLDLANINNLPCLGWGEGTSVAPEDFFFDRAQAYDGGTWESPLAILAGISTGAWESLAQVDNAEALAYLDNTGSIYYSRDPDAAPQAYFSADATTGNAPLTVHFDASLSNDPGGTVSSYQWDLDDGNGQFTGTATAQATYSAAGTYFPTLTVKDSAGQTSTRTLQIVVN